MANYHGDNHGNAGLLYGSSSFSGPTNIGGTHNETHHHYLEGGIVYLPTRSSDMLIDHRS